jgi:hypothetical protein
VPRRRRRVAEEGREDPLEGGELLRAGNERGEPGRVHSGHALVPQQVNGAGEPLAAASADRDTRLPQRGTQYRRELGRVHWSLLRADDGR